MALPAEARNAIARAWLEILKDKHPGVSWVVASRAEIESQPLLDENKLV